MRRQKVNTLSALLLLALLSGCVGTVAAPPEPEPTVPPGALLTIDACPVPEEEFRLFLQDQRALTAAWFGQEYGVEIDASFWQRDFDGQTPTDYAKQKALDALLGEKMASIILMERGLVEDISYASLTAGLAEANADRAAKQKTGEVFYGLTEYDTSTYYAYISSIRMGELTRSQYELSAPTENELRAIYDDDPTLYAEAPSYSCRMTYSDGTEEAVTISSETLGKEDSYGLALYEALSGLTPGAVLEDINWLGRDAVVTLLSAGRPEPRFEDAIPRLKNVFAERELYELLRTRCASASIVFDQAAYDALTIDS